MGHEIFETDLFTQGVLYSPLMIVDRLGMRVSTWSLREKNARSLAAFPGPPTWLRTTREICMARVGMGRLFREFHPVSEPRVFINFNCDYSPADEGYTLNPRLGGPR